MIGGILLNLLLLCFPVWAQAATYYIDDTGSNTNSGTSAAPWLTWAYAFAKSKCGDTLIVMDGTYTVATHGAPTLTKSCTSSTPYTVQAQNQRVPLISGDGDAPGFKVQSSHYVVLDGLRVKSADNSEGADGSIVVINQSPNTTMRNGIVYENNRYKNSHAIAIKNSPNSLVEGNELYWFHRHGVFIYYSNNSVVRRNYCNPRGFQLTTIPGGFTAGGSCVAIYPASNTIVENNIADNSVGVKAYTLQASAPSIGNKFYGNIALSPAIGISLDVRGSGINLMPRDTIIVDAIIIGPTSMGIRSVGAKNTQCTRCSVLGGTAVSMVTAYGVTGNGDGAESFFATNSLATRGSGTGFKISTSFIQAWSLNYTSSLGNTTNDYDPSPTHANIINQLTVNPTLGTCKVWIPDASPLKAAGLNGGDVGASILYRYENGELTKVPLWDRSTGEFPHGALVAGVNDIPGQSLVDVHERLNVNTNGCSFPANYGKASSGEAAPTAPVGLRAS